VLCKQRPVFYLDPEIHKESGTIADVSFDHYFDISASKFKLGEHKFILRTRAPLYFLISKILLTCPNYHPR
jgi:hypothetical protein